MADFDLLVIGGGSGGVACARRAASYARARGGDRERPAGRHLRASRLHPQEDARLRVALQPRFRGCGGLWLDRRRALLRLAGDGAGQSRRARPAGGYLRAPPARRRGNANYRHRAPARRPYRRRRRREAPRRDHRHRDRRPPDDARHPRHRARRELGRDVRPAGLPRAPGDRGRRLHRLRVRLHHARPRRAGDPALPPRPAVARLRLRSTRGALRRDAQGRCRSPPQHQRDLAGAGGRCHRGRDHDRRDDRGRSGALRHRAQAQCRRPRARERGHRDHGGRRRPGRCRVAHGRRRHLRRGRRDRPHQPDAGGDPRRPLASPRPCTTTIRKRPTTAMSRRRSSPRRSSAR